MSDIAIKFENISKQYRLGVVGTGTISHDLNRWWHTVRGKEDPYLKVGEVNDRSVKGDSKYVWALRNITFDVKQGEVIGIIGKNGAGKSTLLKILSRVTSPTVGTIKAKGRIASLLEVGTGFHPELTGRENIYMNGSIMGMTKPEISSKLDEIVDFAGIERYIDTPAKRYSSGMTVRLGFAIAAHLEPEILVVDEVLAVGDAEFQKKAIGKMQDVSRGEGRTVLFVSHNMASIKKLCDRGVLLENGQVSFNGGIDDTIAQYLKKNTDVTFVNLKDRKDRKGSGRFRFTSICFLDEQNNDVSEVFSGNYLKVKLHYEKDEDIKMENMIMDLSIRDDYQNSIFQFISDEMGVTFNENEDKSIILEIPKLMLRGGTYSIRLFSSYINTMQENHCDEVENVTSLTVISSNLWTPYRTMRDGKQAILEGSYIS